MVTIRISGTGFLYNMVRIISGTLIEIGNGQYPPERMDKILKACDRGAAGPTAPAQGLTLMGIELTGKVPYNIITQCDVVRRCLSQ